jgi:hypothetical protein
MSAGAYDATIRRLEQANGRIPDNRPQLKALIANAAQSPDFNTLKERMNTLQSEFTQHYSTAAQMTIDTSGKAAPPAPAASQPAHKPKDPPRGENVAAIEAKVNAGETVNLSDLAGAIKKDQQAAQTQRPVQQNPAAPKRNMTAKEKAARSMAQSQKAWDHAQGKGAVKPAQAEKPSIREELAAGKKQLASQKSAPPRSRGKNAEIGG